MRNAEQRKGLFKGRDRGHFFCRECKYYFYVLAKDYDFEEPIRCPSCNADDTQHRPGEEYFAVVIYDGPLAVRRWHEGYLAQEKRFPGTLNVKQNIYYPAWCFDVVFPHLKRFELLIFFMLRRFANGDGWSRISQRALAHRMSQFKEGGIKTPARQNISKAVKGLSSIWIIYDFEGKAHERRLLLTDRSGGKSLKMKLDLSLPPGSEILSCERRE